MPSLSPPTTAWVMYLLSVLPIHAMLFSLTDPVSSYYDNILNSLFVQLDYESLENVNHINL